MCIRYSLFTRIAYTDKIAQFHVTDVHSSYIINLKPYRLWHKYGSEVSIRDINATLYLRRVLALSHLRIFARSGRKPQARFFVKRKRRHMHTYRAHVTRSAKPLAHL